MAPIDRSHTSSYWRSIVTMALSCIISEIKRYIGRESRFLIPNLLSTPQFGECPSEYRHKVWFGKETRMVCYPTVNKSDDTFSRFDIISACDRQTDGRTPCELRHHSPRYAYASRRNYNRHCKCRK